MAAVPPAFTIDHQLAGFNKVPLVGRDKRNRSFPGGFLMLPHAVIHSRRFRALSSSAVKLLADIGSQYNGRNNGDLSAAWKIVQPKGWRSEATLDRAKKELLASGFISETRTGRRPNVCSLYGLTWLPLDPDPKFDIGPAGFSKGAWAARLPP
jgi:hypothetical protein